MRGQFRFWPGTSRELVIPNNILTEGEESFLKMIVQGDDTDVAEGGDFYVGLCGLTFSEDFTLADIVGEPTVTNGYARTAVTRDNVGWPTIDLVGGVRRAQTADIDFEATGGSFSTGISRAFLCNVSSGTSGLLFSISGALPSPIIIAPGAPVPIRYELFLR